MMADFRSRVFRAKADMNQMINFITLVRPSDQLSDYPGRVDMQELLSLPSVRHQTRLWEDAKGNLLAYAFVDPYRNLVFEIADCSARDEIAREILLWAEAIAQKMFPGESLDASCREDDQFKIRFLKTSGFVLQPEKSVNLQFDLGASIPEGVLPHGYSIRPLGGEAELDAYISLHQAVFGTGLMTAEMRRAIMHAPEYLPDLDLVLVALDGTLAGFLVCQISAEENRQSGRQIGWTDPIGVHPRERGKGMARALLLTGLKHLKEKGMRTARLTTLSSNEAALKTFRSAGFIQVGAKIWWSKAFPVHKK